VDEIFEYYTKVLAFLQAFDRVKMSVIMPWEIIKWVLLGIVFIFALTAITGAPYVPSLVKEIKLAFTKLYKISAKDLVVDLGSGDGVVLKVASDLGAKGFGVEINPFLVLLTKWRFRKNKDVQIKYGNLFKVDFPAETTVVYLFGDARDIKGMLASIQTQAKRLKRDLYVISNGFEFPGLKPVKNYRTYFLYKISHK
jgi:predicted RNA methylase